MRKLTAAILVAGAPLTCGQAVAADFPEYPPIIDIPDVDYGVQGSFYLRGSAAGNLLWAKEVDHPTVTPSVFDIDEEGYGYSLGGGVGYETGTGLRFDVTVDYLANDDLQITVPAGGTLVPGPYTLKLRSTVALANAYYDFGFGNGGYGASGGAFGYVGAGVGAAFNDFVTNPPAGALPDTEDDNVSLAAAGMVGLGYDFGAVVADVGYRALYINSIENDAATAPYSIDNNWIHELRTSVRYRFN
ncbi:outer membrane protein [uncultured Devosia sp.]|uniref:outer membrane protein n=1 Tax=uncultured Devosia sp. TaxID=211434 RepID=UPI0035CB9B9C